jgi:uncharacterized protein (DUF4415 family)
MKHATSFLKFSAEQIEAALAAAPGQVDDPDDAYDPNDPQAVEAFWRKGTLVREGGITAVKAALAERRRPGQRGPGKRTPKEAINIRLSPDVVAAFRATGAGWQSRVDGALKEWLQTHSLV